LVPNPDYWGKTVQIDTLDYYFYPDYQTLGDAFRTGKIQAITGIVPDVLPDILTLTGIRVFTSPGNIVTQLLFNMDADASPLTQAVSGRKALAQATDRAQLIDEANQGQGLIFDGPYIPESWAYSAEAAPEILFDPAGASLKLDELGWVNVEGSATREIEGTPLTLRLLAIDNEYSRDLAAGLAKQWARIGIDTEPIFVPLDEIGTALSEREYDAALVQVQPNADPDLYDFWSQEAIVEGQNFGVWNSRQASESLESGRQAYLIEERLPYYDSFVQTYNEELPAFPLFQHIDNFGLSETIENAEIGRYHEPRDRYSSLTDWFMLYREVAVACPEDQVGEE
jgi:peptide/nickel transport system substrate-binding protein